jgi:hypothetical protein
MSVKVAARTFAVSVFVVFLLWATKALGFVGLMGAFSIGLISFSMDNNLELAMASIVLSGIAIKYVLPFVQAKWVEKFADAAPAAVRGAPAVVERIAKMKAGEKKIEGFYAGTCGKKINGLLEGFEGEMVSTTSGVPSAATTMMGAGGMPTGGATTTSAPATAAIPTSTIMQVGTTPSAPGMPPASTGMPSALTGNAAVGTGTQAVSSTIAGMGAGTGGAAGAMMQVPMASPSASMPMMTTISTTGAAPSAAGGAGAVAGAMSGSAAAMRAVGMNAAPVTGAAPTAPQTTMVGGAIAAPVGQQVPSTLAMPQQQMTPQATVGTALQPTVAGFTGDIESFDGQDATSEPPGLFKLGQLPGESKAGPHIDAGTTIMRALGGLNPNQVEALTSDTQKLLETQKSLMSMISSMKPILQDGAGMLQNFQGLFGGK